MAVTEIAKIGKRSQITIPAEIKREAHIRNGDILDITVFGDIITLRKMEKKPNVLDLFEEVGAALIKQNIDTDQKIMRLTDEIKEEVTNEDSS